MANKNEKILLFEYALLNNKYDIISFLESDGLNAAKNPRKSFQTIKEKYYARYTSKDNSSIFNNTQKYGLDFKDKFGLTPLMIAIKVGNAEIARKLTAQGASTEGHDSNGLIPIQNFLSYLFYLGQYTKEDYIIQLYEILSQDSLLIKANEKLYKVDNHRMEYFLYNYILGVLVNYILKNNNTYFIGFTAVELTNYFEWIPDQILAPYQKRRQYISGILSKNEKNSNNPYGKYLFTRLKIGYYIINPGIEIKFKGKWIKLFDLIKFDLNDEDDNFANKSRLRIMLKALDSQR